MAHNTSIRGQQIKDNFFGAGLARNGSDSDIMDVQVDDSSIEISGDALQIKASGVTNDMLAGSIADSKLSQITTADKVAGSAVQLKASSGIKDDTGLAIEPNDFAGNGLKDDGSDNLALDLNELSDTAIDVANDSFVFVDNDDNGSKKEAVADFVSAIAGTGLTATSGVLSVDAITDNVVETDIKFEDETSNVDGAETDFTLASTPITNSVQVYLNGLLQQEGSGKDYTLSGTTVSFATAPESGDILLIHYIADN